MGVLNQPAGLPLWSDYPRFVRRNRVAIAAFVGIGVLGGLAWSMSHSPTYSATASVSLAQVPVYVPFISAEEVPPEVSVDTDAQLLHSPRVLGAVGSVLGVEANEVDEHLTVTASPNTHVLHLTVAADSPQVAADAADTAASELIEVRRRALGSLTSAQVRPLRLLLSEQEAVLARRQAPGLLDPVQDDLFIRVLQLNTILHELREARREPGEVLSAATPPSTKDYANTEVPLTSGAMVGLLGGCLVGAARDRTRARDHELTDLPAAPQSGDLPEPVNLHKGYSHV